MHTLADPLERARRFAPASTALVCGDVRLSYTDLWRRCRKFAGALDAAGIAPVQADRRLSADGHVKVACSGFDNRVQKPVDLHR